MNLIIFIKLIIIFNLSAKVFIFFDLLKKNLWFFFDDNNKFLNLLMITTTTTTTIIIPNFNLQIKSIIVFQC
jgi:hypothetical protein